MREKRGRDRWSRVEGLMTSGGEEGREIYRLSVDSST